jgi:DNA-binding SARP family transcriptional activator
MLPGHDPLGGRMTAIMETAPARTDQLADIRMLGTLEVRRPDGTVVDMREWRTGKTLDLLRILALRADRPTPVDVLLTALWPESTQARAQSSLRTAVFRIRQVLGRDRVERDLAGLRLTGARVDVVVFRDLAVRARQHLQARETVAAAQVAREAAALYRGDLRAYDDGADWVVTERRGLDAAYQGVLCDAAEASVALGLAEDAVDYGRRALQRNPFSERASRLVMQGYAELGETSAAVGEYERCRRQLAEELGVDPSPQTRAVHLRVVRGWEPATSVR